MTTNEVVLRKPSDLILAIESMLVQMNKKQRKNFLMWVKQKRNQFDFKYPEGFKPPPPLPEPIIQPATLADMPSTEVIKETKNA